ncbi:MAG: C40 family peptidase [Turneriella sp.]|nr:C40 family peptidase [Leptospiraceae bacterium]MCX7633314.1 C40 family peptidase [Turneriella sp.]
MRLKKLDLPAWRFYFAATWALCVLLLEAAPPLGQSQNATDYATAEEAAIRERVVQRAQQMLSVPYKFGGTTPTGFDCAGLVFFLYREQGFNIPHGVSALRPHLRLTKTPRKGDVVFFLNDNGVVGHVGIYVDSEKFIHAPRTGFRVRYDYFSNPYWKKNFVEFRTVF